MVTHAACLPQQIPKHSNFGPELVEFNRCRELVGQEVAFGIVEIVFILLGVSKTVSFAKMLSFFEINRMVSLPKTPFSLKQLNLRGRGR